MAAPTSVSVESKNHRTANLVWSYSGASDIGVYRALFGGSFSLIATVSAAALAYTDTSVSDATRYSYKLSDDVGSTYSSTVSVVVQTAEIVKADPEGPHASPALPRVFGENLEDLAVPVNEALDQIENAFVGISSLTNSLDVSPCQICSSNGAIIVDCRNGCTRYEVDMSENINSITMIGCGECPDIDFNIPSGSSYNICGWPAICGFEGGECSEPALEGGTTFNPGDGGSSSTTPVNTSCGFTIALSLTGAESCNNWKVTITGGTAPYSYVTLVYHNDFTGSPGQCTDVKKQLNYNFSIGEGITTGVNFLMNCECNGYIPAHVGIFTVRDAAGRVCTKEINPLEHPACGPCVP